MSAVHRSKVLALLGATAFLLASFSAHAQETARILTLADCPAGYVLGVQDTDEAQPITTAASTTDPDNRFIQNGSALSDKASSDANAAPRRFITGCIPPQLIPQK